MEACNCSLCKQPSKHEWDLVASKEPVHMCNLHLSTQERFAGPQHPAACLSDGRRDDSAVLGKGFVLRENLVQILAPIIIMWPWAGYLTSQT